MSTGMVHITWSSLNVGIFLRRVEEAIVQFEIFTKQVHYVHMNECAITYMMEGNLFTLHLYCTHTDANTACSCVTSTHSPSCHQVRDLYECRIQANLATMSNTLLLSLPNMETWTTERFLLEAKVGGDILW